MNRVITALFALSFIWLNSCADSKSRLLFGGVDNKSWQTSGNVSIKDSLLILSGQDSYAILKDGNYKDFDLELVMRSTQNGKGYINFHTDDSGKGYRIAINNDVADPVWWRMTGSLLSVRNLTKSRIKDDQWFTMNIRVEGQSITVKIDGEPVVEYLEPKNPIRISPNDKSVLSNGTILLASRGGWKYRI